MPMQGKAKIHNSRLFFTLIVLSVWTAFGVFFGTQNYIRDVYVGKGASLPGYIVGWLICGYSWAALTVPVLRFLRRAAVERLGWSRFLLVHIPAAGSFSLVQLGIYVMIAGTLSGAGTGGYWAFYKFIVVKEFQSSFLVYFAIILFTTAYKRFFRPPNEPRPVSAGVSLPNGRSSGFLRRISIKENGRITLVEVVDINWISSYGNYLFFHTADRRHIYRETMAAMEKKLDSKVFLRIRRSTMVNSERIKELRPGRNGEFEVILKDNTILISTRRYRKNLGSILRL